MAKPAETIIDLAYEPRVHQQMFHRARKRFTVLVCHRRWGKTVGCINELTLGALECQLPDPRFAYLAPLRNQAKDVVWEYLKRYTRDIPGYEANEAELRVDLPGGRRVRLYGADNPDQLRGLYLDGVVFDEFAQMQPRIWSEVVRPALVDRNGWAIFIGTPMGRNAFCELYEQAQSAEGWHAMMFKASETGIIPAAELEAAKRSMTEDQYAQEFECSFEAAIAGAYYGRAMVAAEADGHICKLPWEPKLPVTTAWDLGIGDSTSIWFCQQVGHEIRLIDYYEASGEGMVHYAKLLKEKPYAYREHILPHDADVRLQDQQGRTRREILYSLGITGRVLSSTKVDDGIEAARQTLPQCWFDRDKCARGLEALRQYRKDWDEKLKVFRDKPLHDWTSHAADAFRYLAVGLRPVVEPRQRRPRQEGSWMAA